MLEEQALRKQHKDAYELVKAAFKDMERVRKVYNKLEIHYYRRKDKFELLDRELAMIDGRYEKIVPNKKKEVKPASLIIKLSPQQIVKIAEALGVELEEVD